MKRDLLGLYDVPASDIKAILDVGDIMKKKIKNDEKSMSTLRGKTVVILFYENSTRTRVSFELASKYLGAAVTNVTASTSSVQKGETLIDTGKTLNMMMADYIVMRHNMSGAPRLLAQHVSASVINAGDGINEHPTQALLDMLTMREKFGTLKGLNVSIIGDIKHSRVANSDIHGLKKMGANVTVYSPSTMMPAYVDALGVRVARSKEDAISSADAIIALRIQLERQRGGLFPSLAEYNKFFGLNDEDRELLRDKSIIMHPGPVNRGVELISDYIDGDSSVINEQVRSGVSVRMSVLEYLADIRR